MIFTAKCAPVESTFQMIEKVGLQAVELYIDSEWLRRIIEVTQTCKKFPFRYAVHAPTNGYEPDQLKELIDNIEPEVLVFHDIYWDDEWEYIIQLLKTLII